VVTAVRWALSRTKVIRDLGALDTTEPRTLIDMMRGAGPMLTEPLRAIQETDAHARDDGMLDRHEGRFTRRRASICVTGRTSTSINLRVPRAHHF
jgi:hypothetical protein